MHLGYIHRVSATPPDTRITPRAPDAVLLARSGRVCDRVVQVPARSHHLHPRHPRATEAVHRSKADPMTALARCVHTTASVLCVPTNRYVISIVGRVAGTSYHPNTTPDVHATSVPPGCPHYHHVVALRPEVRPPNDRQIREYLRCRATAPIKKSLVQQLKTCFNSMIVRDATIIPTTRLVPCQGIINIHLYCAP